MDDDIFSEKRLGRKDAAAYLTDELGLKTSPNTLGKLACTGGGPEYEIYGNRSAYRPSRLRSYAAAKLSAPRRNTSNGGWVK